ncbi:MAG: cysteine hydrolase family protein, partial [Clostridia bacterium]|nr:cysteine hydrolase family protein [Clostridia bacterium]
MKKALVIIDAQNDFITGVLAADKDKKVRDKIYEKCAQEVKDSSDLFFTKDSHGDDYGSTSESKDYEKHCIYGSQGHQIDEELCKLCDVAVDVIDKNTIGSLRLARSLAERKYDRIELIGYILENAVLANAVILKTTEPKAEICVNLAYTASVDNKKAKAAVELMKNLGIEVIEEKKTKAKSVKKEAKSEKKETEKVEKKVEKEAEKKVEK